MYFTGLNCSLPMLNRLEKSYKVRVYENVARTYVTESYGIKLANTCCKNIFRRVCIPRQIHSFIFNLNSLHFCLQILDSSVLLRNDSSLPRWHCVLGNIAEDIKKRAIRASVLSELTRNTTIQAKFKIYSLSKHEVHKDWLGFTKSIIQINKKSFKNVP